jgi:hypothetical protein
MGKQGFVWGQGQVFDFWFLWSGGAFNQRFVGHDGSLYGLMMVWIVAQKQHLRD